MEREMWPITDTLWDQTEMSYLKTATDDQKNEYSRLSQPEKGKALIGFVSAQPIKQGMKSWRRLLIEKLSTKAASRERARSTPVATPQQVRQMVRAEPFWPFTVKLAGGRSFTVKHPENGESKHEHRL